MEKCTSCQGADMTFEKAVAEPDSDEEGYQMNTVQIIAIAVAISVASIFVISEIIWYFANQEFEKARDELKESLENPFEEQYDSISEQKEPINIPP